MSAARPMVSVVLPVRNGAATVERAIASIRAQCFAAWELLVVDDGSVDATADLVAAIAAADPRVRLIRQAPSGIVAALNAGIAVARGELIARMDADDESRPKRLAAQAGFLAAPQNRGVGLVGCLVEFGGDRTASAGYALHVDWINSLVTPDAIALNRFVESPFAHPSVMFRSELLARLGGYRAGDFPEDYELWLRWLDAGVPMAKIPEVLLTWNDGPARLSRVDPRYHPDAFFQMKAEWIAKEVARRVGPAPKREGRVSPRRILVWGAGRPTRKRAAHLARHGVAIAGYIDVDAKKFTPAIGGTGAPVMGIADVPAPAEAFVLGYVTSRGARDFIRAELRGRGYVEGRDFLMCA